MGTLTADATTRALVVGLAGATLTRSEQAWIERYEPAGVILFARNVGAGESFSSLMASLRSCLKPDAEIVADHEGGPVSVLARVAGRPPAPWAMGVVDDPDLTRRVHAATGGRLRDLGVDRVLGPCCDVVTVSRNLMIGSRAFGADADRVARHARAAVEGLRETGVSCCLKHWPGHGATAEDTHQTVVTEVGPRLESPFTAAFDAGADAVMLGHLPWTAQGPPASLDPLAAASLRASRPGLGLWSDDLTMAAVRPTLIERTGHDPGGAGLIDPGDLPRSWLEAAVAGGSDRFLIRGIPWGAFPIEDGPGPELDAGLGVPFGSTSAPDESWTEVRHRCGGREPVTGSLVWLDGSPGHRWGSLTVNDVRRAGWEGAIVPLGAEQPSTSSPLLLVTSQIPLEDHDLLRLKEWVSLQTGTGALLPVILLGHPSLRDDVSNVLRNCQITACGFDVTTEELTARFEYSG